MRYSEFVKRCQLQIGENLCIKNFKDVEGHLPELKEYIGTLLKEDYPDQEIEVSCKNGTRIKSILIETTNQEKIGCFKGLKEFNEWLDKKREENQFGLKKEVIPEQFFQLWSVLNAVDFNDIVEEKFINENSGQIYFEFQNERYFSILPKDGEFEVNIGEKRHNFPLTESPTIFNIIKKEFPFE